LLFIDEAFFELFQSAKFWKSDYSYFSTFAMPSMEGSTEDSMECIVFGDYG